ncbi:30S ribosomal protein S20 [Irregularibacter muris]|uniref:Small ribosomal subunit protein bS20 n=1 Tax=Irregularibacter muris TaxID=1796619 RepID=A0AAE3HEU0_9FIRM|nr:30S ribosomal protein S20 [Irregularibacter muris]MCR1897838.1 30S ribosomal protein S20 [Irregularibacter muris]
MANIKSAIKRVQVAEFKTRRNKMTMTNLKTTMRKFNEAVEKGDKDTAQNFFVAATKKLDKAAAKGILHPNAAARKKSSLSKKLNVM